MALKKGCWIGLGIVGFLLLLIVFFVGFAAYTVMRHVEIRPASASSADQEYGRLRDRFTGQAPLLDIDPANHERVRVHRRTEQSAPGATISVLRIYGWNPRDGKIVKIDLPYWLLRFQLRSGSGRWSWGGNEVGLEDLKITIEDLERNGPGLILDYEGRRGDRVLIWTE